jgi:L-alanine-DL-glutamate epimerase-like enolase superfamily enzyme
MSKLCQESPVPVALDEELIGVWGKVKKQEILERVNPHYLVLKPTLLGGFTSTREWIKIAESMRIKWWITSALESNIGLNAICQFTAEYNNSLHQGLGTGQLYHNNIPSPLIVQNGRISYRNDKSWDLHQIIPAG